MECDAAMNHAGVPGVCITPGSRHIKTVKVHEKEDYWSDQLSTTVAHFESIHIPNTTFESSSDHNPAMIDALGITDRPNFLN
jgi:hypothetical protein